MKLRFTPRATENLNEIGNYLFERNPVAARRVRADIYDAFQTLILFPSAGRPQKISQVRKLASRRYAYLIFFLLDDAAEEIVILNVKHPARERGFEDA